VSGSATTRWKTSWPCGQQGDGLGGDRAAVAWVKDVPARGLDQLPPQLTVHGDRSCQVGVTDGDAAPIDRLHGPGGRRGRRGWTTWRPDSGEPGVRLAM
jgi:hypothetical protein